MKRKLFCLLCVLPVSVLMSNAQTGNSVDAKTGKMEVILSVSPGVASATYTVRAISPTALHFEMKMDAKTSTILRGRVIDNERNEKLTFSERATGGYSRNLDVNSLPNGAYTLEIMSGRNVQRIPFVKNSELISLQ